MSDRNSDPDSGNHSRAKRSLPSWMSSIENTNKSQKKQNDATRKMFKANDKEDNDASSCDTTQNNSKISKLLEGVVFVLSGFVNPERGILRAQALEMGAEYQPDWISGCTLLICAFTDTPKFRQVEADCGTIVSKEWILECYNHKKLVDIERYLMYTGKPWRRCTEQNQPDKVMENALSEDPIKNSLPEEPMKRAGKKSMGGFSSSTDNSLVPSQIKEWATVDLGQTVSWLESQDEKPQAMQIRGVAAEGILTCLQDVLDSLKQNQDINTVTDKWMFTPRIVTYLAEIDGRSCNGQLSKEELYELAFSCKKIYENELRNLSNSQDGEQDEEGFDSDQTIEMTEEEIDLACKDWL